MLAWFASLRLSPSLLSLSHPPNSSLSLPQTTTLKLVLSGEGLQPVVSLTPRDLSFGDCVVGLSLTETVRLHNSSPFPVEVVLRWARAFTTCAADRDDVTVSREGEKM